MKPIIKIMSVAGLLLGFLSGCQQVPELESEFILKAASFNQEDTAIANQFGCSEKPQVFQFAADSTVQSLHYTVYKLNQGEWEVLWTGDQSLSGTRGRIAVYSDSLPAGYTLILQCDNICVKDELRVDDPDFTMPEDTVLSTASLKQEIPFQLNEEIPVILQRISTENDTILVDLEQFFKPDTFAKQDDVWALTLIFQGSDHSLQLPSKE